jgi:hypothetical protein
MKITGDRLKNICKIGTDKCCAYLICGAKGFECGKNNLEIKIIIDKRLKDGKMNATGDNCSGLKVLN